MLGPNGAGKTTIVKMLVGLLEPTEGSIEINNIQMKSDCIECKKQIGYVPDIPFLYDKLTGYEYLQLISCLWQINKKTSEKNINKYLELMNMISKKNDLICTYSYGMKQKISLCAALVHEPKVLILDEPLLNLDPIVAKEIKDFLVSFRESGNIVFLSTHLLEVAEKLYTRIGILDKGILVKIFDRYANNAYRHQTLEEMFIEVITG